MVTRESTLRQSFDPAVFHRSTQMTQAGWAEREVRHDTSGLAYNVTRFSSSITFILGALLVLLLRPIDLMDGRDVVVSSVAVGACWLVAAAASKVTMRAFSTTVEVDRVIAGCVALLLGVALASTGLVAQYSQDLDDYISSIPGHTLTAADQSEKGLFGPQSTGTFTDVGTWKLDRGTETTGSVSVFLVSEQAARDLSERALFARALHSGSDVSRRDHMAGEGLLVARVGGLVQLGWLDEGALIVVSGKSRNLVDPAAKALIKR